jgi:hypothetical protein
VTSDHLLVLIAKGLELGSNGNVKVLGEDFVWNQRKVKLRPSILALFAVISPWGRAPRPTVSTWPIATWARFSLALEASGGCARSALALGPLTPWFIHDSPVIK